MTRVLLVIKTLDRGGAEQLLLDIVAHIDRSRYDVEIAYLKRDMDALADRFRAHGVPVWCLEAGRSPLWVRRLGRLVAERAIDVVHCHSPLAAIGARLCLIGSKRPRLVYTEHSVWEGYRRSTYWANLLTFGRNDHVFVVSNHVKDSVRYPRGLRFLHMPPVETMYHGIDPGKVAGWSAHDGVRRELGIPPSAPLIVSVANFTPQKGHPYLLEATRLLRTRMADVRLVLVGVGPLEGDVRQEVHRLGLEDNVVFTGSRDDAQRLAGAADVFALSSVQEGLSVALIEAMALARPVVVTNVGGLPEVVRDGAHGFVVGPRDPEALARALSVLLRDRDLRERFGRAARSRAEDFDVRIAVRRIERVYEELVRGRPDRSTREEARSR